MVNHKKIDNGIITGENPIGKLGKELGKLVDEFSFITNIRACQGRQGRSRPYPSIIYVRDTTNGFEARGYGGPGTQGYQPLYVSISSNREISESEVRLSQNDVLSQRRKTVMDYLVDTYSS